MAYSSYGAPSPPSDLTLPAGSGLSTIATNAMTGASMLSAAGPWGTAAGAVVGGLKGLWDSNKAKKDLAEKNKIAQTNFQKKKVQLSTEGTALSAADSAGTGFFTSQFLNRKLGGKVGCKDCGGKMDKSKMVDGGEFMQTSTLPQNTITLIIQIGKETGELKSKEIESDKKGGKCKCGCKLDKGGKCGCGCELHAEEGGELPSMLKGGGAMPEEFYIPENKYTYIDPATLPKEEADYWINKDMGNMSELTKAKARYKSYSSTIAELFPDKEKLNKFISDLPRSKSERFTIADSTIADPLNKDFYVSNDSIKAKLGDEKFNDYLTTRDYISKALGVDTAGTQDYANAYGARSLALNVGAYTIPEHTEKNGPGGASVTYETTYNPDGTYSHKINKFGKGEAYNKFYTATNVPPAPVNKPAFRDGGTLNVIPDGVLHSQNNELGDKGIPVVMIPEHESEEFKKVAEIERDEIIFTLEVSEKLEEYAEKLASGKITEEELLAAGKLIVDEILNNTVDMTGKFL